MEEAHRHAEEHGFKQGSGNKWWRLFQARNTDVVSRTPSLVESQRADSRLDEDPWQDFFGEASKALAEVDYDGRYIVNMDETSFHQNFITRAAARKVYSIRGRRSVPRRQGYQCKAVTVIAAVVASGEALPPTLLFDTKTVKESHLRYCDREVIPKSTGTGWSSSEIFVEWVEQVLVPRLNPLYNPYNKIVLFLDGSTTHLGVRGLTVCKKVGVSVVLFPSHATDIIQPLDRASLVVSSAGTGSCRTTSSRATLGGAWVWPDSFPSLSRRGIKHAPVRRSVQRSALQALYGTAWRPSYATPLRNVYALNKRRQMPSPWSFLRSWLPVLYLQVTSLPHLKSPLHPKTPRLPPEKWDPKQPHGPSPWKQRMMQRRCALADGSRRPASLQPRRLRSKNVISKRKPRRATNLSGKQDTEAHTLRHGKRSPLLNEHAHLPKHPLHRTPIAA